MNKLLDIILCSGICLAELIGIIIITLLIQLIIYQLTGFSIYNKIMKLLRMER